MKIAVAQIGSIKGDVTANTVRHLEYTQRTASQGVNYLVFPELSLTGYEPELASKLCFTASDVRLMPFVDFATQNKINIGIGAPMNTGGLPRIGLIVVRESGIVETYEKMHLHPGEEAHFSEGRQHHILTINNVNIANAICADTNNPVHAKSCAGAGASVYMAGVLVTPAGYDEDAAKWRAYANEYSMLVAIANYNAPSGGWPAAGRGAVWFKTKLLASADETQDALVVAEKQQDEWTGYVLNM